MLEHSVGSVLPHVSDCQFKVWPPKAAAGAAHQVSESTMRNASSACLSRVWAFCCCMWDTARTRGFA